MPLTIEQQRALAVAQAKRKRAEAEAGPNPNASNPIITAQRQSQTQAMSQWAQQQEARKAAEARQAQERREAARALGGGMDMMVGQDAAGNVRPGSVVDTDLGAGITGSPLSFGQGLAEGAANTANTIMAASTGLGNAALNVFDPNRQQSQPMRIQVPRNALLDDGGALQSISGVVPRIAGQIAGPRVAIGKVTPGGDFGANAAKDAIAIGAGTPQDAPRLSDMFPEGTPIADMLRTREGDNAFTAFGKNAAEDLLASTVAGGILKGGGMLLDAFGRPRAAAQATTAPPVSRAAPDVAEAPAQPAPFSAPAEPKASSFLARNADRIVGGSVGGFLGGAGDAFAASGGDGNGGPDIVNPYTGAAAGMFLPRAAMRGYRGLRSSANFDERVAARAVRNVLSPAGIKSAEQAAAEFTARFGDKPASVADLAQGGVGLAANLSRLPGATGEAALARGEQLLGGRAGRLERDIGQANPKLNPGAITGDVDRIIALAQEQATPAYNALKQQFPEGSVNSERLAKIEGIGSHIKAVDEYRAATKANEGRTVSDFEYWDLVKRDIDAKEQQLIAAGATMDDIRVRKLEGARAALVKELDDLMPDYAAARQLGGEAPKMREAFKQGQKLLDGNFLADEVSRMVSEVTGQQLTATQAGVIRNMMKKTQNGRTAMAALMSSEARKKLEAVFGKEASDAMQARFAADAAIMTNMQRISPNVGSVTSQAELGGGGGVQQAAELAQQAVAFKTNPLAAGLAFLSRSGSYTKAQRDRMGEMLLGGNDPANLARIYGARPPRNPLNVEAPPTPQGPPVNRLGMSGSPEALGAAGGTAIGMATAPDQNGDGVVDAQERMMGGAGGALTGGIAGRGVRALGGRATSAPAGGPQAQGFGGGSVSMRSYVQATPDELDNWYKSEVEQVATNSNRTTLRLKSSPETQSGTLRKLNDVHINFQNEGAGLAVDMTFRGGHSAAKYTANPKDVAAATRVFAKTLAAINVYVRKNNPGYITFTGASEAHNRLYQKLMERANIKGYTAIKDVSSSSYMNKNAATGDVIGSTTPRPYERFMLIKDEELANFQRRRPGPVTAFSYQSVGADGAPVVAVSKNYADRRPVR